ncbi:MAG: hypothetical protein IJA32_07635 [Lachnospiraceae bacterium]|nr:hypothetical protein [Lachnospiraceae bacterium]
MELVKNKRIGKILFIVEGSKHEFSLIKKIFEDILGYKRIEKRRTKTTYYQSQTDSHSVVAVINTKTSNIGSINENEYLDVIFQELLERYDFDVNNAAIYYLFDRDPISNTDSKLILNLIRTLKNSRENENNLLGGMLILSYPSIEAYEVSNFYDATYLQSAEIGDNVKKFIASNAKNISLNKISAESIVHACNELLNYATEHKITLDFDNFANANERIFLEEEQYYQKNHSYFLLSMMSCVLLDLGILKEPLLFTPEE